MFHTTEDEKPYYLFHDQENPNHSIYVDQKREEPFSTRTSRILSSSIWKTHQIEFVGSQNSKDQEENSLSMESVWLCDDTRIGSRYSSYST